MFLKLNNPKVGINLILPTCNATLYPTLIFGIMTDIIPVCTLSPTCSSDIITVFPLSRFTVDVDGKQWPLRGGGGFKDATIPARPPNLFPLPAAKNQYGEMAFHESH